MCGSRKYPYPTHGRSLEIPRGRGGSKAVISEGYGGFMGNYFPRGDRPCTKHWKQCTIDLKHKNIPTYVVLKQKSVLLAIDMRLTSLALMFLFFFELASATISRRTMCLWNEVENDWKWRTWLESCLRLVFVRPTLKCFHFCSLSIPFGHLDMQDTHFW